MMTRIVENKKVCERITKRNYAMLARRRLEQMMLKKQDGVGGGAAKLERRQALQTMIAAHFATSTRYAIQ